MAKVAVDVAFKLEWAAVVDPAEHQVHQLANTFNKKPALADASQIPSLGNFIDGCMKSRTDIKPPTKYLFELAGKYLKMFFGEKTLIALCRLAGLRRGEALALPWSAIDWEKRWLTVFATKTGAKRIVPIEPKLHGILKDAAESCT